MKKILISLTLVLSLNCFAQESFQGSLPLPKRNYDYVAIKRDDGSAIFNFLKPIPGVDGNVYMFFMSVIPRIYPDAKGYMGNKMRLQKLKTGVNVIALDGEGFTYMALLIKPEGGKVISAISLFREEKAP